MLLIPRGDAVTFSAEPPFFSGGAIRSLYATIFIFLILWMLSWTIECIYKVATRKKTTIPKPGQEMGAEMLNEPSTLDYMRNACRVTRDGFIIMFGNIVINASGALIDQAVIAIMWVNFILFTIWALTKFVWDSGYVDGAFVFVIGVLEFAIFGLSFR